MFQKILIANRGEIACRVAATAARMGVRTVAVYSDADAHAAHVQACDEAVHVGGDAAKDSYLQWERLLQAALTTGAQAIHPGYGFLSENADFARACAKAGVVFIGPRAESIEAMGLKAASKQRMEKAGVPLVPGYHGADQSPDLLAREAQRIGYPVLIKASAGGGGKGMRIVTQASEWEAALASCQREALQSFGNDAVLIEKYVQRPRHIEIQVFGDTHGQIIHLHERDCSVQRRHQKVLEESPAPGLSEDMRQRMGAAAVAAAKAVNYVGAGTVEFIVSQTERGMDFYFMEMNTRLQVEHPVTEAVTGLDLVEWQLRVAFGEPLPLKQDQVSVRGHAIEARICAENPDHDFLPATGPLKVLRVPPARRFKPGPVRWDSGVREGDRITPYYDSMVAKLIVHGDTRTQALARLDQALAQLHILGLHNNVSFLRRVLHTPSFKHADLDTALIQREKENLFETQALPMSQAVAVAVAARLRAEMPDQVGWQDPWSKRNHWRMQGSAHRVWMWEFAGQRVETVLTTEVRQGMQLRIDNPSASFEWIDASESLQVRWGEHTWHAHAYVLDEKVHVFSDQGEAVCRWVDPLAHASQEGVASGHLGAPMPGKLLSYAVAIGERVAAGQALAVMEAMKMEHTVSAPNPGVVTELCFAPGDQVPEGAMLLQLKID